MTALSLPAARPYLSGLLLNKAFVVLAGWLFVVARSLGAAENIGVKFNDTDDAMRLVEVRDLLAGQGWFDLVQHRLDPAFPVPMHWSRLVDAPIALLILLFERFTDVVDAERLALTVWPLLVLLAAMAVTWSVAVRIGGQLAGPAAIGLLAVCYSVLWQFAPGRIDHHNVQVVLSLGLFAALFGHSVRSGALAGLCCALMLAVGLETVLLLACAGLTVAARFVVEPEARRWVRAFGLALAASTAVLLFVAAPPSFWTASACDSLSLGYAALAVIGGAGLALAASAERTPHARLVWLAAVGAAAVLAFGGLAPACLRGPFGQVDGRLWPIWLDNVEEMRSIVATFRLSLVAGVMGLSGQLFAVIAAVYLLRQSSARRNPALWGYVAAFALSMVVGLIQIRTAFYANMFAIPLVAAALSQNYADANAEAAGRSAVLTLLASLLLVNNFTIATAVIVLEPDDPAAEAAAEVAHSRACMNLGEYADLAREPPGFVLSALDSGPFILAATRHSVLSAPYHRQATGILDGYAILTAPPEQAVRLLRERGLGLVALCSRSPLTARYAKSSPDGLWARLGRGEAVAGLQPISTDGLVRTYRVVAP